MQTQADNKERQRQGKSLADADMVSEQQDQTWNVCAGGIRGVSQGGVRKRGKHGENSDS